MKKFTLLLTSLAAFSFLATFTSEAKATPMSATVGKTIYSDADGSNGRGTPGDSYDLMYTILTENDQGGTLRVDYIHIEGSEVTLPETVTYEEKPFVITEMRENGNHNDTFGFKDNTTVQKVNLPSSLQKIGGNSFSGATSLQSLNIPESVTNLGPAIIYGCNSLDTITMNSIIPPTIMDNTFAGCREDLKIYVPCSVYWDYKNATNWSNYESRIYQLPHVFGTTPSYSWDGDQCTASLSCTVDLCDEEQSETVTAVYVKDSDATFESDEKGHYVATFVGELFEVQTTPINSVIKEGTKLQKSDISAGAIVGISVGSVAGACLISYIVMFFVWKKNNKSLKFLTKSFEWLNKLFVK